VKKVLSLIVALGIVALFSGVTLAGADCSYHKTQAAVDKPDASTSKDVVTAPADNTESKVQTAQADSQKSVVKPASVTKK
jgi:hypothetical protein